MSDFRATLLERLRDPRAIPILARHSIPVAGVFVFGWSALETIAALVLDALSTLWLVGAVGSYFAARELDTGEGGLLNALHFWAAVLGVFLVIAAILTFAAAIPAAFFLPLAEGAEIDPWTLLSSGWLARAFALMVACQIPTFVQRVRSLAASGLAPEKMGMDAEVGFVLHRIAVLAGISGALAIFGRYALHLLVLVAQVFGAVSEIMRDRYIASLMPTPKAMRSTITTKRRRKKRR